ncbi:hypothetical protein BDV98DRAFT_568718 [Pterulicium gracile]|uniref:Uncharacterized protein n=1 Tax=Pterulicium gracile TaxID=1884261 RepID=A0A5C3QI23_9AGAR|nr:hypothetical protein BDV98DRAFT_568718 [Pterula gracilis]
MYLYLRLHQCYASSPPRTPISTPVTSLPSRTTLSGVRVLSRVDPVSTRLFPRCPENEDGVRYLPQRRGIPS